MAISKQHLEQLNQFIARSTEVNEEVMSGIVPNLMKNSNRVVGREMKKNFFYRQWTDFEDFIRRNLMSKFLELATLVYYTNAERGEKYIQFAEAHFALLRATLPEKQTASVEQFWEVDAQIDRLKSDRRTAVARGDKQKARELTPVILQKERSVQSCLKASPKVRTTKKGKVKFLTK